jgi:SAM-dependent methyltransferase
MFKSNTMQDERNYQRTSTIAARSSYLATDVTGKYRDDDGYRKKVDMMAAALRSAGVGDGWIVDVGAGTCGEDECLALQGFKIICTDVNDIALATSESRSEKFGRPLLKYAACDGQKLPFADASVRAVIFNESLHHLPNADACLAEVSRILLPGGAVCMLEPYAYDPWRRLSEVRDYFKGSIEKSFSVSQLKRMLGRAGLETTRVERPIYLSRAKLKTLPAIHRLARVSYYAVREAMPRWLGMILLTAKKPGQAPQQTPARFEDLLRCPITGSKLEARGGRLVTTEAHPPRSYPISEGIPLLIEDEAA